MSSTRGTLNLHRGKAQTPAFADVIGWQEANHERDRQRLVKTLTDYDHYIPARGPRIPISWRRDTWRMVESGERRTHAGLAKVTPGRFVCWVVLRHVVTGVRVAHVNTHAISGAWSKRRPTTAWRRRRWVEHMAIVDEVSAKLLARDLPVVLGGDFNTHDQVVVPGLVNGWSSHVAPYDQILSSPVLNARPSRRGPKYGSDHHSFTARYQLAQEAPVPTTPRGFAPFATVRNIPPGANDPEIKPRVAILHVDAANAESLFGWFSGPSGGVESHFFVKKTGKIEQYRSIYFEADANLGANPFGVSIETQGFAAGKWTPMQTASIERLLTWLETETDIPLRMATSWKGSGVGYHSQFPQWSPVVKSCPGPDRIKQFHSWLIPWMGGAANHVTRGHQLMAEALTKADAAMAEWAQTDRPEISKARLCIEPLIKATRVAVNGAPKK